jgi:hypothetical protein
MQTCYNMTPAEQYKYTGQITESETEELLQHSAALAELYDIFWDVENAINERKPKAVVEFIGRMRKVFDEAGI